MAAKATTDANFKTDVLDSKVPVLVDFWAPWCGPCRRVAPAVDEVADEYEDRARVFKLDTDENPQVAARYGVASIPTLLIFKEGKVVDTIVGVVPKAALTQKLARHL